MGVFSDIPGAPGLGIGFNAPHRRAVTRAILGNQFDAQGLLPELLASVSVVKALHNLRHALLARVVVKWSTLDTFAHAILARQEVTARIDGLTQHALLAIVLSAPLLRAELASQSSAPLGVVAQVEFESAVLKRILMF